ncbi:hypothetical protein M409DRAFT_29440 [Zasmidium cellare ATCC 36951]|uniref:USP domain-containing protein n=1 Tax=Zasmidium cellare ATCC 36951 TaxID=1080233 RepID=A0A6A6BZI1_ZASCE|nr:uncharacterized protein M409DRAFT_29440 [Zasmidium cellare ATCC 36951]KAF2160145.1 hypothetical protein M409DRAFT_29440 [Zasmidium cellare ATCC 36951]
MLLYSLAAYAEQIQLKYQKFSTFNSRARNTEVAKGKTAQTDPYWNPTTQCSALDHVQLLESQIKSHNKEITSCNKIEKIQAEIVPIPQVLFGHYKPKRDKLEQSRQAAWQPRAKEREKSKKAAEEVVKAEQNKQDRSKKLRAYHDDFDTYTGTARDSSSRPSSSRTVVSSEKLPENPQQSTTLKRKRSEDQQQPVEIPTVKKAKASNISTGFSAEKLATLGRIPKKSKSPAEEETHAISPPKANKRKRPAHDGLDEMAPKRRNTAASKASPKPESTPQPRESAPRRSARLKVGTASKKTVTFSASPQGEEQVVEMNCGFKRSFDTIGDLEFIEHELNCAQCRKETCKPNGFLGLSDRGAFNSALQLLDAALIDEQVTALIGDSTPNDYGLAEKESISYVIVRNKARRASFEGKIADARSQLQALSKEDILLAPYVGQALQKVRGEDDREVSTLLAQMSFEVKVEKVAANATYCLHKILAILIEEHPTLRKVFEVRLKTTRKCSSSDCRSIPKEEITADLAMRLQARDPEMEIIVEDGEELEAEVKFTMRDLIAEAVAGGSTGDEEVECQSCGTGGAVVMTKEVTRYPSSLVISIDHSTSSEMAALDMDGIKVNEKVYRTEAVVHKEKTGAFVSFRRTGDSWWRMRDEDVDQVRAFQVQDHVRGQWVLALLKQKTTPHVAPLIMAPAMRAQLPAMPLTDGGIKYEKRLRDIQAGKAKFSEKNTSQRIKAFRTAVDVAKNTVVKEERLVKYKQGRIDKNDEVAKAYKEANDRLAAARATAQDSTGYNPFAKRSANAPKPKITKKTVRVPLAQQPGAINRPVQRKQASGKDVTQRLTQDAGIQKNSSNRDAKKNVAKKVTQKEMSEEEVENKGKESALEADAAKSAKKRKLTESAGQEEQGPSKKARSSPELTEEKTESKPSAAQTKKAQTTSTTAPRKAKKSVKKLAPVALFSDSESEDGPDGDSEMLGDRDLEACETGTASKHDAEKAATSASANKKRKADQPLEDEGFRATKKAQQSSEADLAKAGDEPTSQASKANGSGSSEPKPVVAQGEQQEEVDDGGRWREVDQGLKEPESIFEAASSRSLNTSDEAHQLRGLLNSQNACFANSAVQVLNSVLSDEQVETLRGEADLSLFGIDYKKLMQTTDKPGQEPPKIQDLRTNISATAAIYGNIKVAPYLGQLLIDLRDRASHKSKKNEGEQFVTPVLFQQVFAYGCGEADARLRFKCSTQEDSQEYLMEVINALVEEGHTFVRDLFKIGKTTTKKCTACGNESTQEDSDKDSDITISVMPSKSKSKLADLLDEKLHETSRPQGCKCEKCGVSDARENVSSITKLSDDVLVHVERTGSEKKETEAAARIFKDKTVVEWAAEGTQFQFGDDQYEVAAVIRHEGSKSTAGHYDAFVKHDNNWNQLNDQIVKQDISTKQMADGIKGQCAVILLRKLAQ